MLTGEVALIEEGAVVLSCHGVGYLVHTTPHTAQRLTLGAEALFHTHLAVRETALDLYGFNSAQSLELFELLLSVSGIGPKSALNTLSLASEATLIAAIREGNAAHLHKSAGVGKKTAEKIVLELRDKVALLHNEGTPAPLNDDDALEGLRSMGYTLHEARDALAQVAPNVEGSSARLREALRLLGKR